MKIGDFGVKAPVIKTLFTPTLESIAFQHNDPFGPKLEVIVSKFMELVDKHYTANEINKEEDLKKEMTDLIKERLGLTVKLICNKNMAACVPNVYLSHSAVVRKDIRDNDKIFSNKLGFNKLTNVNPGTSLGTVDTNKVYVTGWLSEQPCELFMNWVTLYLVGIRDTKALVSILLHELGHIFEGAAKAATINDANQIVSNIARYINSSDKGSKTELIYQEFKKLDPDVEKATIEGLSSDNSVVFGVSAFRAIQGSFRSISGATKYNNTSFEALADSFATRFGYGLANVEELKRYRGSSSEYITEGLMELFRVSFYGYLVYTIASTVGFILSGGSIGVLGILVYILRCLVLNIFVQVNRLSNKSFVYDDVKMRMQRIRNDMVEALKDKDISKDSRLAIIEQIKACEKLIESTKEVPNIIQKLYIFLDAQDGRNFVATETQQKIEKLIANQIFVRASELQLKA